jgi:alkanesulfonate monooxygenase SsuD/methylene tetrahydromethanopterin reductase-like flavin-dependent oxidoreductase (luciferase family)
MLREALQIIHAMWTEDYATFEGQRYQVRGAINEPKGVQKPHPPIWIGGAGEKVTLKLVAQYGDACNISGINPENYRHKFAVLREHCDTVGRDYNSIIKSANMQNIFLLAPDEVREAEQLTEPYRYGQPLDEWRKTNFVGTAADLIALCEQIVAQGADYLIMYVMEAAKLERLRLLAQDVLPTLRTMTPK